MRPRRLLVIKILLPLFAAAFCLILLEAACRIIVGRGTMHLGVEMWNYARKIKQRGADEEIGHRHRPNASAHLMGVDVQTNSLGLRDSEVTIPAPPDTTRIVVLGDSLTFGWGVAAQDMYTEVLERSLNAQPPQAGGRYEVVNTGVGNTNTSMQVNYYRAEGAKLKPDLLLISWFINDAEPTPKPNTNWLARNSYAYVFLDSAMDGLLRRASARQTYKDFYGGLYTEGQPGWVKCQEAFRTLGSIARESKVPTCVVLLPELHTFGSAYEFKDVHAKVTAVCTEAGLPVLDLTSSFQDGWKPEEYWVTPTDAHPNARAHAIIAAGIEADLRNRPWLK